VAGRTGVARSVTSHNATAPRDTGMLPEGFMTSPLPTASSRPSTLNPTALTAPDRSLWVTVTRWAGCPGSVTSHKNTVLSHPQASSRPSGLKPTALTPASHLYMGSAPQRGRGPGGG